MLTKGDIDKNAWESKKYGWNDSLRNFQTRNGASVVLKTFRSDCEQRGPLDERSSGRPRTTDCWERWRCGGPGTEPAESTPDTPLHLTNLKRSRNTSNK